MALTKTGTDGIKDDAVTLDKLAHGTSSQDGKFLRANNGAAPSFETVSSVGGSTGADFNDDTKLRFGGSNQLEVFYGSSKGQVKVTSGQLELLSSGNITGKVNNNETAFHAAANAQVELYHNGTKHFETQSNGIKLDSAGDTILEMHTSNAGAHNRINFSVNAGDNYGGLWYSAGYNSMEFRTNNAERMQINSLGDLQIGQVANDCRLGIKQRSGNPHFIDCRDTSSTLKMYVHSSGNLYNTNGSYGQTSDQSLKENIVDAKSQWNDIKNIKIRNFNFTKASGLDTHTQIGCVAQEVEKVSPKLVTTADEDGLKTVQTSVLYMKAVKALQEAMAKIEVLETKVAALEAA